MEDQRVIESQRLQGRRIRKTGNFNSIYGTSYYLYSGQDILAEYLSWDNPIQYVQGPGTDNPIQRISGASVQYYHQDGINSVVAMTDGSGATAGSARYDAWGNKLGGSGTIAQYGYTGREPVAPSDWQLQRFWKCGFTMDLIMR